MTQRRYASLVGGKLPSDTMPDILPVGTILQWAGERVPRGWAECDGKEGRPDLAPKPKKAGYTFIIRTGG